MASLTNTGWRSSGSGHSSHYRPDRYAAFAARRRSSRYPFPPSKRGLIPLVRVTPEQPFLNLTQNLKRWWGANNHWQQSRRVLELWMQVRSTGYALMHLLALHLPETFPLATIAPWRKHQPVITAGLFAAWMRQHFFGLAFRHAYDRKSEKFTFPAPRPDPLVQPAPA